VPVLREFGSVRRMGHGVIGDHGTEFP